VEEPESHLHPGLHAALAERFCELAERGTDARLLVETHSENILLTAC
jgi:predicted ATPase